MARPDFSLPVGLGSLAYRSNSNVYRGDKPKFKSDGPAYLAWTDATLGVSSTGGGGDYRAYMKMQDRNRWSRKWR